MALAGSFKAQLITAARKGEAFDLETGLPESMVRKYRDVSFLAHAQEFTAFAWKDAAAKSRISIIKTLSRVVPVVTYEMKGAPDPDVLRAALRKSLNQGSGAGTPDRAEARALAWLAKASRPVSAFEDESVVCDVLDALATRLDGKVGSAGLFCPRAPGAAPGPRLRSPEEAAAETRSARTTCPRDGPPPRNPRNSSTRVRSAVPP